MGENLLSIDFGSGFIVSALAVSGPRNWHMCVQGGDSEWKCYGYVGCLCLSDDQCVNVDAS